MDLDVLVQIWSDTSPWKEEGYPFW